MHVVVFRVAEQRRKRIQDLEGQIQQMRKKLTEQMRMLKMKEQSDKQVEKLNQEIMVRYTFESLTCFVVIGHHQFHYSSVHETTKGATDESNQRRCRTVQEDEGRDGERSSSVEIPGLLINS